MEKSLDRRLADLFTRQLGHVGLHRVIYRVDRTFRDRNSNQHGSYGFCHRLRKKSVVIGGAILVVFVQYGLVVRYQ